jgi:hypothetical protein
MKNLFFIVFSLIATQSYAATELRIAVSPRGDNHFLSIQIKTDRAENAIIESAVLGNIQQSFLSDPENIALNADSVHIDLSTQTIFGEGDSDYNLVQDSMFNDGLRWSNAEILYSNSIYMRVLAETASPLAADNFFPIWYVVSKFDDIIVVGSLEFPDGTVQKFSNLPEPSSIVLIILGVIAFCGYGRIR